MKRGTHPNTLKNLKPAKKGEIRNPKGINRKRPISQSYHEMAESPVPEHLRIKINEQLGKEYLPSGATWSDANAVRRFVGAVIESGGTADSKEIREAIEGKAPQRIEVAGAVDAPILLKVKLVKT